MRKVLLLVSMICGGCGTIEIRDSDSVDSASAYVLLNPRITTGNITFDQVDLNIVCVDDQEKKTSFFLPRLRNNQLTVIKAINGICFLDTISTAPFTFRSTHNPSSTVFEARRGTLNYPGQWNIDFRVLSTTIVYGHVSQQVDLTENVTRGNGIEERARRLYPQLTARLPFLYSRLVAPKNPS